MLVAAFSATLPVAALVKTGVLSFTSLTVTVTARSALSAGLPVSLATTVKVYVPLVSRSALANRRTSPLTLLMLNKAASPTPGFRL